MICSSLSVSQTKISLSMIMRMIMTTKKIEKRFFHWSLRECVKHNNECDDCHLNCHCYAQPDNKNDGTYLADHAPVQKLHPIILSI